MARTYPATILEQRELLCRFIQLPDVIEDARRCSVHASPAIATTVDRMRKPVHDCSRASSDWFLNDRARASSCPSLAHMPMNWPQSAIIIGAHFSHEPWQTELSNARHPTAGFWDLLALTLWAPACAIDA